LSLEFRLHSAILYSAAILSSIAILVGVSLLILPQFLALLVSSALSSALFACVVVFRAVEKSSSLLPARSQHGHSRHRAPLGPMAIYLFNVKTFVFFSFFRCSSFDKKRGVGLFSYN
jgi:hypothetical protein